MKKPRILIVEDDQTVAADIEGCLEDFGYEVIGVVSSGEEAIKKALAARPSLVLMDIHLEGKVDGISVAQEIRSRSKIPVIFLTGHADPATLARAKVTEPYGYVIKPFKPVELRVVTELALYRSQIEQQTAPSKNGGVRPEFQPAQDHNSTSAEQESILQFLQTIRPFSQLEKSVLVAAARGCHYEDVKAGDFVTIEGDEIKRAFLVVSGRVALRKSSASGKDLIVELLLPKDTMGLLIGLQNSPSPFSAKTQLDSRILWVPYSLISYVMDNYPELSRELIEHVLERLRRAHNLSRALAHDRVEVRVASALVAMTPSDPNPSSLKKATAEEIHLSRQELADMTGTAAETASRVANAMERDGLIDLSQLGIVRVLDRSGLVELSQG